MSTKTLSIFGLEFTIAAPYTEGQTINAAEAKTLNQTRTENISNNVRKAIKDLQSDDGAFTAEAAAKAAELVAKADASYVFTLTNVGSGRKVRDPIEAEAISIAKSLISAKLKEQGRKVKDVNSDDLERKIEEVAAREDVRKMAAKRVKERQAIAAGDIDI